MAMRVLDVHDPERMRALVARMRRNAWDLDRDLAWDTPIDVDKPLLPLAQVVAGKRQSLSPEPPLASHADNSWESEAGPPNPRSPAPEKPACTRKIDSGKPPDDDKPPIHSEASQQVVAKRVSFVLSSSRQSLFSSFG